MILVTGGAGFIGSHLVRALAARDEKVRVLDNLSRGRIENLRGIIDNIDWIEGDIRRQETVQHCLEGCSDVLHLAASPPMTDPPEKPVDSLGVDLEGTINLLEASRRNAVKKFIFISSGEVYGDNPDLPWDETAEPSPLSVAAIAKLTGEHYCRIYHRQYGLSAIVLRCFNVFGPAQDHASPQAAVVPRFVTALLSGSTLEIHGDGRQKRDFVFIEDVVRACLAALDPVVDGFRVLNVASGRSIDIIGLAEELAKITGRPAIPDHTEPRPGDIRESGADISRAADLLGYRHPLSLTRGLRKTVDWFAGREKTGSSPGLLD